MCLAVIAFHPITVWASEAGTHMCSSVAYLLYRAHVRPRLRRMLMATLLEILDRMETDHPAKQGSRPMGDVM